MVGKPKKTVNQNILEELIERLQQMKHLSIQAIDDDDDDESKNHKHDEQWTVGIWELRLSCYSRFPQNADPDHMNHLEGAEIVYQHDQQAIKAFEAGGRTHALVLEWGDEHNNIDLNIDGSLIGNEDAANTPGRRSSVSSTSTFTSTNNDQQIEEAQNNYDNPMFQNMRADAAMTLALTVPPALAVVFVCVQLLSKKEVKSMRMVLMWSAFILTFILTSVWLNVLHQSYRYFDKLAEEFKMFTNASTHASWYQFYRSFTERNSISESKKKHLIRQIRKKKAFDLADPKSLTKWNKTSTKMVQSMTSGVTTVNEINLMMTVVLTGFFLLISGFFSYVTLLSNVQGKKKSNKGDQQKDVGRVHDIDSFNSHGFGWWFLGTCLVSLTPILITRYNVTRQDEKQLNLLKETKARVEINGIEDMENEQEERLVQRTIKALDIIIRKVKDTSHLLRPTIFGIDISPFVWNFGGVLFVKIFGDILSAVSGGVIDGEILNT